MLHIAESIVQAARQVSLCHARLTVLTEETQDTLFILAQ
jgi:hypothetical protein